jgi:hypothetical protein
MGGTAEGVAEGRAVIPDTASEGHGIERSTKSPGSLPGAFDVGRLALASEEFVVEAHFEDMLVGTHVLKVGKGERNTRAEQVVVKRTFWNRTPR